MEGLAELALLLGAGIALVLLCRPGLLWYWQVNERVRLAREQNALLREVRDALRGTVVDAPVDGVDAAATVGEVDGAATVERVPAHKHPAPAAARLVKDPPV